MIISNFKKDFILFTIFLVVVDIIQYKLLNTSLFSDTWMNLVIGTYIGLLFYHMYLYKLTYYIIKKYDKILFYDSYEDIVKYLTIFICQYVTMVTKNNINIEWFVSALLTLTSFILFALIEPIMVPRLYNINDQILLNNLIKIGGAVLLYSYFITGPINDNPLLAVIPLYIAFCAFHFCNGFM